MSMGLASRSNEGPETDLGPMFEPGKSFSELGLSDSVVAHLNSRGLTVPTKVQAIAVPTLLRGLRFQTGFADSVRSAVDLHSESEPTDGTSLASLCVGEDSVDVSALSTNASKLNMSELDPSASESSSSTGNSSALPDSSDRGDVLMLGAETGSGKTLAYLAPVLEAIREQPDSRLKALVMVPSRELCAQVARQLAEYFPNPPNHLVLAGGQPPDVDDVKSVRIVIATPAALLTYFRFSQRIDCNDKYIVIDEADMLLSGSFLKEVEAVLDQPGMKPFATRRNSRERALNKNRLIFVGATYPHWTGDRVKSIITWMRRRYPEMRSIQTDDVHKRSMMVTDKWMYLPTESDRIDALLRLLREDCVDSDKVMVFCGSSERVMELEESMGKQADPSLLSKFGSVVQLHKKIAGAQRGEDLASFRTGQSRLLLCTDLAARGLDLGNVTKVVEFDFSTNVVGYLHRIGRTARAGASGSSYHFYDDVTRPLAEAIRQRSSADVPVVEGVFSRRRSFRRKMRKQLELESSTVESDTPLDVTAKVG